MVGNEAALQIQETIKNIELTANSAFAAIFGGIMLLIGENKVH